MGWRSGGAEEEQDFDELQLYVCVSAFVPNILHFFQFAYLPALMGCPVIHSNRAAVGPFVSAHVQAGGRLIVETIDFKYK